MESDRSGHGSRDGESAHKAEWENCLFFRELARPEGFEPPTPTFVALYSIQLSYGRTENQILLALHEVVTRSHFCPLHQSGPPRAT